MFCNKCGAPLDDDAIFCTECGNKTEPETTPAMPTVTPEGVQPKKPKKPVNTKLLAVILAVAVALTAGIGLLVYNMQFITFGQYINDTLPASGYSGLATVSNKDVVNYDALKTALGSMDMQHSVWFSDDEIILEEFSRYINVSLDKTEKCSNGDTITATVTVNYDALNSTLKPQKKLRGKRSYTVEYTIDGLEETTSIDPFAVIKEVEYYAQKDRTTIIYDTAYNEQAGDYQLCYYNADYTEGLAVKDAQGTQVCVLTFRTDAGSYTATQKISVSLQNCSDGKIIHDGSLMAESVTKEYDPILLAPVSGADQLTNSDIAALKELATKKATSQYSDAAYEATYFLSGTTDKYKAPNRIYFIFRYKSSYDNTQEYCGISFNSLLISSDGKTAYLNESSIDFDRFTFYGDKSLNDVVQSLQGDYTVSRVKE